MLSSSLEPIPLLQRAAFKVAWQQCHATPSVPVQTSSPSAAAPASSSTSSSWSEAFAPKLMTAVVTELKRKFKVNFPSEILLPETTPGIRLLSLVRDMKSKGEYKWVPWKYRISQQKADELQSKSSRAPKAEHLQLHHLILDSPPELTIDNGALGLMAVRQMFEVRALAMAMCGIAHMATLKVYYLKFMSLMAARMDPDTGLRGPTILEAQAADRTIMTLVSDLVVERSWSYDNALYELTHVRAEIHTLLQARPKLTKQTVARLEGSTKGSGKSDRMMPYGKSSGKGKSKTKGKVAWVTETIQNGKKIQLCMRYQSGKCQLGASCKFAHGCAYPMPNGEACMKSHGALQHAQTPH